MSKSYIDPREGVEKPERRQRPRDRSPADLRVEQLFSGFHNLIENARYQHDAYTVGYVTAMKVAFAEYVAATSGPSLEQKEAA